MGRYKFLRKVTVILIISVFLAFFMNMRIDMTFSDVLFVCSMMFFLTALMQFSLNLGVFSGAGYGFKSFYRFLKNKEDETAKPEPVNRIKYSDIIPLFFIGIGLFVLAVIIF